MWTKIRITLEKIITQEIPKCKKVHNWSSRRLFNALEESQPSFEYTVNVSLLRTGSYNGILFHLSAFSAYILEPSLIGKLWRAKGEFLLFYIGQKCFSWRPKKRARPLWEIRTFVLNLGLIWVLYENKNFPAVIYKDFQFLISFEFCGEKF